MALALLLFYEFSAFFVNAYDDDEIPTNTKRGMFENHSRDNITTWDFVVLCHLNSH